MSTHDAYRARLLLLAWLGAACSVVAEDFEGGAGALVETSGAATAGASPPQASTGGGDEVGGDGAEPGSSGASGGQSHDSGFAAGECSRQWPEAWLFCEDFEALADPSEAFFEYNDAQGAFVLDDQVGYSGTRSMRATYQPGAEGAGWISVSLGDNPIAKGTRPQVAVEDSFDDLYWRFRVRMDAEWQEVMHEGAHLLSRATAFAGDDWRQAMLVELGSLASESVLAARVATCVEQGEVVCVGYQDVENLQWYEPLIGETALYDGSASEQWHCIEVHVRLNTPGQADGVLEFFVDGVPEARQIGLDYRGTWDAYGLNLVALENTWVGGAPALVSRWLDDWIISTEPIGCEPLP